MAVVKLLLDMGKVDVDSKDYSGRTPLSWATEDGHEAVMKLLFDTGKVYVDSKDKYRRTPLSWAWRSGNQAVVNLLRSSVATQLGIGKHLANLHPTHRLTTPPSKYISK